MAWSAPMTATFGSAFTAAQWNAYVRDNLGETATAKAPGSSGAYWFASASSTTLALRQCKGDYVAAEETTTQNSYGNLGTSGPSVTLTTGTKALVMISARLGNDVAESATQMSYSVSGATNVSPDDTTAIISDGLAAASAGDNIRTVAVAILQSVNAGTNTFTAKYKCSSNTGRFACRQLCVWSF